MLNVIHKLRGILTAREGRKFAWLLLAIVAMGFLNVIGIAFIMPFMRLVSQPDAIEQSRWLGWAYTYFGFEDTRVFLFATGTVMLLLLATSNLVSAWTKWLEYRFVWSSAHTLAVRLLHSYLYQPYEFFLQKHSSNLAKQVLSEVNQLVRQTMLPGVQLIAHAFVALVIFALLVAVDPRLASTILVLLGGVYALIYFVLRTYLVRLGTERFDAVRLRFKAANEALGGIKTIKVRGYEAFFGNRFAEASRTYTSVEPKYAIVSETPRYFVETLAFGGILVIVLYLLATEQSLQEVIPLLSLYALAGYRLLPSLQRVFRGVSSIRFNTPIVDALYHDLTAAPSPRYLPNGSPDLTFAKEVRVRNLSFRYAGSDDVVLHNINLTIPKNTSAAFVGPTGSGKTSLVDLLVGLLPPSSGTVLIDGTPITPANVDQWQRVIGYVPQEVLLYDDTVARNIALGLPDEEIDMARVTRVAEMVCIHAFILNEMPLGYDTLVGERGVRLSGGQRQRIGLARALYHDPQVLILDEATSALDGITEESVIQAISEGPRDVTTIMIAHRLATVQHCDRIYLLEEGTIVAEGTYEDLIATSATFRSMARIAS